MKELQEETRHETSKHNILSSYFFRTINQNLIKTSEIDPWRFKLVKHLIYKSFRLTYHKNRDNHKGKRFLSNLKEKDLYLYYDPIYKEVLRFKCEYCNLGYFNEVYRERIKACECSTAEGIKGMWLEHSNVGMGFALYSCFLDFFMFFSFHNHNFNFRQHVHHVIWIFFLFKHKKPTAYLFFLIKLIF